MQNKLYEKTNGAELPDVYMDSSLLNVTMPSTPGEPAVISCSAQMVPPSSNTSAPSPGTQVNGPRVPWEERSDTGLSLHGLTISGPTSRALYDTCRRLQGLPPGSQLDPERIAIFLESPSEDSQDCSTGSKPENCDESKKDSKKQ